MLYIHGHVGKSTYKDVPIHVEAAVKVVELLAPSEDASGTWTFSMHPIHPHLVLISTESVAYQVFLLAMGFWSTPEQMHEGCKLEAFWTQSQRIAQIQTSPVASHSAPRDRPVLGTDPRLIAAMLKLKRAFATTISPHERRELIQSAREHIASWSEEHLESTPIPFGHQETARPISQPCESFKTCISITDDITHLIVSSLSILLQHLTRDSLAYRTLPQPDPFARDLQDILAILKRRRGDPAWASTYLGFYPVWTAGISMRCEAHRALVREDLRGRWEQTRSDVVRRYARDLEEVWRKCDADEEEREGQLESPMSLDRAANY